MTKDNDIQPLHAFGIFGLLLLAYHLIFKDFFPLPEGGMGHDYALALATLTDGFLWFRNNGIAAPWFTPSFCGGQAFFADPQSIFYSVPQFLAFFLDPVQAAYLAFLIFAALGYFGMYRYASSCLNLSRLSSVVAGGIFMFNGFYASRMIIGHYGFQAFMLVPAVAYLLLSRREARFLSMANWLLAVAAGALIAYWFHSGMATLMVPATLCVITLACLQALRSPTRVLPQFFLRGTIAGIIAIGLCASKLNANLSLMGNFSRDYYRLPGIADVDKLLFFVFQSLFYPSEQVYHTITPYWRNIQWAAMPHELAFGITLIPLILLAAGAGIYVTAKRKNHETELPQPHARLQWLFASALLALILAIPIALLYYSPAWNAVLKSVPLVNSTTSPSRWLIIFIPLIIACTAIACDAARQFRTPLAVVALAMIPLLNALDGRDYYRQQDYDPAPLADFHRAVQQGQITPRIHAIGNQAPGNAQLGQGISPARCYNPLYGYRLEKMPDTLVQGSISTVLSNGALNLRNPACLVFPGENNCKVWDNFNTTQSDSARKFASYLPFHFEKSRRQILADLFTTLTLAFCGLLVAGALFRRRERYLDQIVRFGQKLGKSLTR